MSSSSSSSSRKQGKLLRRLFRDRGTVLFCGGGVNDAPALAAANVGVAKDAHAMERANVTLLDFQLGKIGEIQSIHGTSCGIYQDLANIDVLSL